MELTVRLIKTKNGEISTDIVNSIGKVLEINLQNFGIIFDNKA